MKKVAVRSSIVAQTRMCVVESVYSIIAGDVSYQIHTKPNIVAICYSLESKTLQKNKNVGPLAENYKNARCVLLYFKSQQWLPIDCHKASVPIRIAALFDAVQV